MHNHVDDFDSELKADKCTLANENFPCNLMKECLTSVYMYINYNYEKHACMVFLMQLYEK